MYKIDKEIGIEQLKQDAKNIIDSNSDNPSYHETYGVFKRRFGETDFNNIDKDEFTELTSMVYSWMPRILILNWEEVDDNWDNISELLTKASSDDELKKSEIETLSTLINNSIIGTSKVLHFINPEKYPIWDSRVREYLYGTKNGANNINRYGEYRCWALGIIEENRFDELHNIVRKNIDYDYEVTEMRAIEQVCFYGNN